MWTFNHWYSQIDLQHSIHVKSKLEWFMSNPINIVSTLCAHWERHKHDFYNTSSFPHLYISNSTCSRHCIETPLYIQIWTPEHPIHPIPSTPNIMISQCLVWNVLPWESSHIIIWSYQQVGMCAGDIIHILDYLYMNITELNKAIHIYNIVYNEWT